MGSFLRKISPYMIVKGIRYLKHFGWKGFWTRVFERLEPEEVPYGSWYEAYRPTEKELEQQAAEEKRIRRRLLFSILVPCFRTPERYLREMIESVLAQTCPDFELCLANADPEDAAVQSVLEEYAAKDPRVRVFRLEENAGISANTNALLAKTRGEYIGLLDHDDLLSPAALHQVRRYLDSHPGTMMVYTDEDKIDGESREHFSPNLKPDFNLDLLRSNNYICHFLVAARELALKTGGFREEFNGAQDYDFILRCAENAGQPEDGRAYTKMCRGWLNGMESRIGHVPEILYHWRTHAASTADNPFSKTYAYEAGRRALEEHLKRCGCEGTVSMKKDPGFYRIAYRVPEEQDPVVSVLIPNKDHPQMLRDCLESLKKTVAGIRMEILVIENNSTQPETFEYYRQISGKDGIRVITWDGPFNYAAINNFAAGYASGDYLLLLNNDIKAIREGWLQEMLGAASREEVGAAGAKLLYPDDTVQHAGIVIGIGGVAGSVFTGMDAERSGYLHKADLMQNLSAVTAACLLMRRSVFEEIGGFEEKLAVAFNDVDLCLRIREAGYLVVYDPYAVLYHYESKTRGPEDTAQKAKRFQSEIEYMRGRWTKLLKEGDPCYNKNLSLSKWNYSLKPGERMR